MLWRSGIARAHIGDDGIARGNLDEVVVVGWMQVMWKAQEMRVRPGEEREQLVLLFCYKPCILMTLRL